MRPFFILIFLSFLVVITEAPAGAAFNVGAPNDIDELHSTSPIRKEAAISYWFTGGHFEMEGGPPAASNRWVIEHPTDGKALLLETEFRPTPRLSYDVALGIGIIDDGRLTDTDFDAASVISDLSYSTAAGFWSILGTNVYIRALGTSSAFFDLSAGYLYFRSSVDYKDPTIRIANYVSVNNLWQERWLEYDLSFYGVRFGARGEIGFSDSFSLKATAGVIPWLQATYDGLRYPQRPVAQQQIEGIEADGLGLDALVGAEYAPYRNFVLTLGYKYLSFETEGKDRAGTPWAGSWEELSMELKGPFVGLGFSF